MRKGTLSGKISLDGGVLLEVLAGTRSGQLLRDLIVTGSVIPYTCHLSITEAQYILCRKVGWEEASLRVHKLLSSNVIEIVDDSSLHPEAARIKCHRSIALPDCYTLALAEIKQANALFAFREAELMREMSKEPFNIDILFLEET